MLMLFKEIVANLLRGLPKVHTPCTAYHSWPAVGISQVQSALQFKLLRMQGAMKTSSPISCVYILCKVCMDVINQEIMETGNWSRARESGCGIISVFWLVWFHLFFCSS
jgi:hypothetical protein